MASLEGEIEEKLVEKLLSLKYEYRQDIRDRDGLVQNFREKFQALNRVNLEDAEFDRLLEEIITPDVFAAARTLRERNSFIRDDGTPLNYTLVNINDWCKNTFEVINQLRINTDNSHHRYDVILLINGVPVVQIELKSLGINPRRAMEQIVEYKNDPGNGYARTLLCFMQLFIVSNRSDTWYFANNNNRNFSFNADEQFLPVYQFADIQNKKITHLDSFAEAFLPKWWYAIYGFSARRRKEPAVLRTAPRVLPGLSWFALWLKLKMVMCIVGFSARRRKEPAVLRTAAAGAPKAILFQLYAKKLHSTRVECSLDG